MYVVRVMNERLAREYTAHMIFMSAVQNNLTGKTTPRKKFLDPPLLNIHC